jgi:hypothetical protein
MMVSDYVNYNDSKSLYEDGVRFQTSGIWVRQQLDFMKTFTDLTKDGMRGDITTDLDVFLGSFNDPAIHLDTFLVLVLSNLDPSLPNLLELVTKESGIMGLLQAYLPSMLNFWNLFGKVFD